MDFIDLADQKYSISVSQEGILKERIINGCELAFSELFDAYWEPLFFYVANVLNDRVEASDIVQDSFIALWQKRDNLHEVMHLKSYLFGIARYKSLKQIRLNTINENHKLSFHSIVENYNQSPELSMMAKEMENFLEEHIQQLPCRMREIFVLSRFESMSHAEIGIRLNIAESTVKKQIQRALRQLRTSLDQQDMWSVILLSSLSNL